MNYKNLLNKLLIIFLSTFTFSCGMPEKEAVDFKAAYKECNDSMKLLDIYNKDGTHFTEKDDFFRWDFISTVCSARARLYLDGYRIKKTARDEDVYIYRDSVKRNISIEKMFKHKVKSNNEEPY
jgi:hypothetical protein